MQNYALVVVIQCEKREPLSSAYFYAHADFVSSGINTQIRPFTLLYNVRIEDKEKYREKEKDKK